MKKAIEYLKTLGIKCDKNGKILSKLPSGLAGIELTHMLEENTQDEENECCYTILGNNVTKIDI